MADFSSMLQGFFTPGGADDPAATSPQAMQYKRAMALALQKGGMDYSPVQSPWQGLARVAQALSGALDERRLDAQEAAGQKSATDSSNSLMSALLGGGQQAAATPAAAPATTGTVAAPAAATSGSDYERPDAITPTGKMPSMAMAGMGAPGSFNMRTDYLPRLAQIESGGNPNAVNAGSKAAGLFQFVPSTWKQYAPSPNASPLDPQAATQAVAGLTADNAAALTKALGRAPTPGELYLAHQQGAGGAIGLLSNPNARAGDIVGDSAVASNGGDPDMPASAFANKWINKFQGTSSAQLPTQVASLGAPAPSQGFQPAPASQLNDDAFVGSDIAKKEDAADQPAPQAQPASFVIPGGQQGVPTAGGQPAAPAGGFPTSQNPYAAAIPRATAILNNPYATPAQKQIATAILQKGMTPTDQYRSYQDADGNTWQVNTANGQKSLLQKASDEKTTYTDLKSPEERAAHGVPVDFKGPVQVDSAGKLNFPGSGAAGIGDQNAGKYTQGLTEGLMKQHAALATGTEGAQQRLQDIHAMQGALDTIQRNGGTTGMGQDQMTKLQSAINTGANAVGLNEPFDISDKEFLTKFNRQLAGAQAKNVGGARVTNFELNNYLNANPGLTMSATGNKRLLGIQEQIEQRNVALGQKINALTAKAIRERRQVDPAEVEDLIHGYDEQNHITDPVTGQDLTKNPKLADLQQPSAGSGAAPKVRVYNPKTGNLE